MSAAGHPMEKTNVMRLLDAQGIPYRPHAYDPAITDGQAVADAVGKPRDDTYKTLVAVAGSGAYYVFVIPVSLTLSLKKAAAAVGEKSISMLPQRELLPLTGYVHGGCSPIGMKKPFPVVIDELALLSDAFCISAGKRGFQVEVDPQAIANYIQASFADVTETPR